MPGPIDDALKHLTELSPQDWVVRGGWPAAAAALIDADIGTISGAADKAIRVSSTPDWLLAIDFQSGHDSLAKLPDLLLYNSALFKRHGLPVRTLLVLLHRGRLVAIAARRAAEQGEGERPACHRAWPQDLLRLSTLNSCSRSSSTRRLVPSRRAISSFGRSG